MLYKNNQDTSGPTAESLMAAGEGHVLSDSLPEEVKVEAMSVPDATQQPDSTPAPSARKIKFGAVVEDYENKTGGVSDLEAKLGIRLSSLTIYKHFGLPHNRLLSQTDLSYIKSKGYDLTVTWEPFNPNETTQSVDYLKEIPTGAHDEYISKFVDELKNYPGRVTLRFAHEMNGDWYPWGLRPEEYKAAYRYIVNKARAEGATNIRYMWSINAESSDGPISTVSKYYPGDDVVDVIGIDGYNYGSSRSWSSWKSFELIFAPSYNYLIANHPKPIVISEFASAEEGGSKPQWIADAFAKLSSGFARVEEVVWFNVLKEADWRVDSTRASLQALRNSL